VTSQRRTVTCLLGISTVLALTAAPAAAHPYVHGGELPVDSLATMTLDLAHGCDPGHTGAEEPTTEVALDVPGWLRIVDVPEPEGWTVELEEDDTSRIEVVTFLATDGGEPAPTFDLDVVASGEVGDEVYLGVFQGCDDSNHRWVGTPDEPADEPGIRVTLSESDPDRPPPPEPSDDAGQDGEAHDDGGADGSVDDAGAPDGPAEASDDAGSEDEAGSGDDATQADDADDDAEALDTEVAADDGGAGSWILPVVLGLAAAVGGFLVSRRLRERR
jgi:uncharacterized protein YcnI